MPSLQSSIMAFWIRRMNLFGARQIDPIAMRKKAELATAHIKPPRGVRREEVLAGGVPGEWLIPSGPVEEGAVLYLHGGAWFLGSTNTHRRLTGALAQAGRLRVLCINYRLAPEHPFPAALQDCQAAYEWLLANGVRPEKLVVAGDSAGGNLALALLVTLRDQGKPLPAGGLAFSPATDLTGGGESNRTRKHQDPYFKNMGNGTITRDYIGTADPRHPLISPLFADLHGLPPMLLQVGDHEILLDDSLNFGRQARAAGVEAQVEVWPGMFHVFQLYTGLLPEAGQAIRQASKFIHARLQIIP